MALEWTAGKSNIFIRPMCFTRPGYIHDGHEHEFDHTVIYANQPIRAEAEFADGSKLEQDFQPKDDGLGHFLIDANVKHRLRNMRPSDEEIVQSVDAMSPEQMRAELIRMKSRPLVAWCVYGHRDPQGEVLQRDIGWSKAYAEKARG